MKAKETKSILKRALEIGSGLAGAVGQSAANHHVNERLREVKQKEQRAKKSGKK